MKKTICIFIFFFLTSFVSADSPLVTTEGVGARSLGMGNNFTAIANDYSAIFWNPAGLAFIPIREVHASINNAYLSSSTKLNAAEEKYKKSHMDFSSLGYIQAIPTIRGGFTFALGYSTPYNLSELSKYNGLDIYNNFNSASVNIFESDTLFFGDTLYYDLVKYNANGTMGLWSIAAGWQVAKKLGFGFTVSLLKGDGITHKSVLSHTSKGLFDNGIDISSKTNYTGFDIRIGGLYQINSIFSTGIRLKFPQRIRFNKKVSSDGISFKTEGTLRSSFNGAIGLGVTLPFSTISTDLIFRSPHTDFDSGDLAYWKTGAGIGLEIPIKKINTMLRCGYTWKEYDLYPYAEYIDDILQEDPINIVDGTNNIKLISTGLTYILSESITIDLAYLNSRYATDLISKDWKNVVQKDEIRHRGQFTVSIRY